MNPNSLAFFSLESQFPTAAVALELLFRLRLDGCASAMWTLHRTNLSHEIPHAFKACLSAKLSKQACLFQRLIRRSETKFTSRFLKLWVSVHSFPFHGVNSGQLPVQMRFNA